MCEYIKRQELLHHIDTIDDDIKNLSVLATMKTIYCPSFILKSNIVFQRTVIFFAALKHAEVLTAAV